jgi:hypothetical protein
VDTVLSREVSMTALVAALLVGTAAAPAPPTAERFFHTAPHIALYFGGYAEGFAAGREGKLPVKVYT